MTAPTNAGDLSDDLIGFWATRHPDMETTRMAREIKRCRAETALITGAAIKRGREAIDAVRLANQVLDTPYRDPDDDLSMMSRQFLRALEREAAAIARTIKRCAKIASIVEPIGNPVTEDYEDGRGDAADAIRALLADPAPGGEKEAG